MTLRRQVQFWVIGFIVFLALVYVLRGVMLPFVAGMAVAYFFDPMADRLEMLGISRNIAVSIIIGLFLLLFCLILLLIVPLLIDQLLALSRRLPQIARSFGDLAQPFLERYMPAQTQGNIEQNPGFNGIVTGVRWVGSVLQTLITQGAALANLISLLFITPIVAFYLLRDWDRMVATLDQWLPIPHRSLIHRLILEIDQTLSGFVRGQATVCLALGLFYGVALWLIGLDFALAIGILSGLIAFIPFVGTLVGFVVSVGVAAYQFGHLAGDWSLVGVVTAIFIVGQILEGNVLTPKFVGERIGLHAVWVIFALLAGGTLFGFTGVMLALPVAAIMGVLIRFGLEQYFISPLYMGSDVLIEQEIENKDQSGA